MQVVVGGVIPEQDYPQLFEAGAIAIFGSSLRACDPLAILVALPMFFALFCLLRSSSIHWHFAVQARALRSPRLCATSSASSTKTKPNRDVGLSFIVTRQRQ